MIQVDEARGRAAMRRFTELPYFLFRLEPRWAPPLIGTEKARFDRFRNEALMAREHVHLLARVLGAPAGRLAVELDDDGVGWVTAYDVTDDPAVALALVAAAREWLDEYEGTGALHGPEVLVAGFEHAGVLGRPWHPTWYAEGLRAAGLEPVDPRPSWRLPAGGAASVAPDPTVEVPAIVGRYGDRRLVLPGIAAVPDVTEAKGSTRELLRRAKRGEWSTAVVVRCDGDPSVLVPALAAAAGAAGYREVIAPWSPDPEAAPETVHATFALL